MSYPRQQSYDAREQPEAAGSYQRPRQAVPSNVAPAQPINHQLTQPHLRAGPLDLNFLPAASTSQTSLLEAVVGPTSDSQPSSYSQPLPQASTSPAIQTAQRSVRQKSQSSSQPESRDTSEGSRSFGTSTEREWDVLSDASFRINEADPEEAVEELQKKVNKRRSNLPHLESQLAELEAQIKAAEERIARVQSVDLNEAQGGQTA